MAVPAPFACEYTPNFAELLQQLNISLAISTYQAGKVIFISAKNAEELYQLPRTFHSPMGIAVEGDKLAIATKNEIIVSRSSSSLAANYPKIPNTYDALYLPTATYHTGAVDLHDLCFGERSLWAVNTSFSTLCLIEDNYSFIPVWKPKFITEVVSEDRCHLNGMAMEGGKPKYVSALGAGNTTQSWRKNISQGGVLIDVESNEVIASELAMPHSPRIYNGKLYLLLSAAEKLVEVDVQTGSTTEVAKIPGFLRGMCKVEDYLFITTSKLRQNSSTFKHLKIAQNADVASIVALHLPTGAIVGKMKYLTSIDEIYDIQVLKSVKKPNLLNTYTEIHKNAIITPESSYWGS